MPPLFNTGGTTADVEVGAKSFGETERKESGGKPPHSKTGRLAVLELIDQVVEFFAESLEHPVLGLAYGPCGHFQFRGDFDCSCAIHGGAKKSPPRSLLEIALDHIQSPAHEAGCLSDGFLAERFVGILLGNLGEPSLKVRAADRLRTLRSAGEIGIGFILRDGPKPAAKSPSRAVFAETVDSARHGANTSWAISWASLCWMSQRRHQP